MKKTALVVLCAILSNNLIAQIPRSYGDITFLLPSAYSMQAYPDAAVMHFLDENESSYLMFIFPAVQSSGNLQKDFADAWNKMYGVFSRTESGSLPPMVKKIHPKGWDYYEGGGNCIHSNGRTFYGWLSVHSIDGKLIAFGSAAPTQAKFGYNLIFTNTVLNSIDLAGYNSSNRLSGKSGFDVGISGVWQSVKTAAMLDGSTGRAIKRIVFYDDSVFCYEMPSAGLDSIDRAGNESWRKGYWGTYAFDGSTGRVNFSTYKNEPLGLAGSNLTFFNIQYEKLRPVDRLVFEGTYTSKPDKKDWWRGYEPVVKFKRDGTFEDNSALFDVDNDVCSTCPTQKPGRGKYLCQNYSLVLFYDDGRKGQIALYTIDWKKPTSPEFISLGKGLLKMKK